MTYTFIFSLNNAFFWFRYQPNEPSAKSFKKGDLQHKDARGVAIKKTVFGEGSERLAHQFFEVAADGQTVVGESLVAKESRFIEEEESNQRELGQSAEAKWKERDKFVKRFCKIQHVARKAAKEFNSKLDDIWNLDPDTCRVSFLDCSLYYLTDKQKGQYAVLVEKHLHGNFQKWNNNNGVSYFSAFWFHVLFVIKYKSHCFSLLILSGAMFWIGLWMYIFGL